MLVKIKMWLLIVVDGPLSAIAYLQPVCAAVLQASLRVNIYNETPAWQCSPCHPGARCDTGDHCRCKLWHSMWGSHEARGRTPGLHPRPSQADRENTTGPSPSSPVTSQCCPGLQNLPSCAFYHFTRWQMTNAAEHPSIKYISGVNDALRDVKSAIFNKGAPHQKYLIQSNSLSWAKRNKSLCVFSDPPLKGPRLVQKNGRAASYYWCFLLC